MKNIILSLLAILFLLSCYDDKSELPSIALPSIVANRTGETEYLMASVGEEFTYTPKLGRLVGKDTIPLAESEWQDYSYQWSMTLISNGYDTTRQVIGNDRILKATIVTEPTSGQYTYYTLILQVVHRESGVTQNLSWKIKVLATYDLGLLVAETSDEVNSDISLIMSRTYNQNLLTYEDDTVHHKIFSKANGMPIGGVITSLSSVNAPNVYTDVSALVAGKTLVRMNPITMKVTDQDQECFFYTPKAFNPQLIFDGTGNKVMLLNNGKVQYFEARYTSKFSVDIDSEYDLDDVYVGSTGYIDALFFDKKAEKFVQFSVNSGQVSDLGAVPTGVFDPNNLKGVECVFGDVMSGNIARWLVKKEGRYFVYEMDKVKFTGMKIYDLENCPDIDKSPCYAFSISDNEFFYAVGNILYAVPLGGDKPTRLISYDQFPQNEKITHLLIHKGTSGQTTWDEKIDAATGQSVPNWRRSRYTVISVVTYDGKEGRVYTLPIQYAGSGGIAPKQYVNCYDKFGRITAIALRR